MHISELFPQIEKKKGSQRNDLMRQIYAFYDTAQEDRLRKIANWRRYVTHLKVNKIKDSNEEKKKFPKNKTFIKKFTPRTMAAYYLSHVKTADLWFVLSVAKDKGFRNESVGSYICGLSTCKEKQL